MIYENIVQTIGKTPIVRINGVHEEGMAEIYAKLEFFNPGGSAKDRIAANKRRRHRGADERQHRYRRGYGGRGARI